MVANKNQLTVTTPVGAFTRTTHSPYTHVVVREGGERIKGDLVRYPNSTSGGVLARWKKDNGFAVTWHSSQAAADKASRMPYAWDKTCKLVGVFPVDA